MTKMIYIELSFNVDQPEITGSSRLKVTAENVKTFKCDFAKKMASSFTCYSDVSQLGAWGLHSQFPAPNSSRIGLAIRRILI